MTYTKILFGFTINRQPVFAHSLTNACGAYVEILDYGCRVRSISVPDAKGTLTDVCLGYSTLSEYENDDAYFGAAIGRCANLIGGASFSINGTTYLLNRNDGTNHLHGGSSGFSFHLWRCELLNEKLVFTGSFPHLSDGYPGHLNATISYEWTEDNQLIISYEAVSDRDTIINLTNHTYFNLEGPGSGSVMDHELWVNAKQITEVAAGLLPTGRYLSVEHTPFDFQNPKPLGRDIHANHPQLIYGCGYDHNFVLEGTGFHKAAILQSLHSGIRMTCYTDQPGLQIYTGNGLDSRKGKYGELLKPGSGVCLETQHFTDSIHQPHFPSVILKAHETFRSQTAYHFSNIPDNSSM